MLLNSPPEGGCCCWAGWFPNTRGENQYNESDYTKVLLTTTSRLGVLLWLLLTKESSTTGIAKQAPGRLSALLWLILRLAERAKRISALRLRGLAKQGWLLLVYT